MRMRKCIFFTLTLSCLVGCENSSPANKLKENFRYWSNKPGNTCAKMAGRDYCFEDQVIAAKNWLTDPVAGFLLDMPVSDPELIDCNKQRYLLRIDQFNNFPSIQVSFGEEKGKGVDSKSGQKWVDSTENYFDRMHNSFYGGLYHDILFPILPNKPIKYHGLDCFKAKADAMLKQEALCQVGKYGDTPPPHFFSCDREGSVPFPGCKNMMFYRDIRFNISYNKKCAPHHALIRHRVVEYIDRMEIKRGNK